MKTIKIDTVIKDWAGEDFHDENGRTLTHKAILLQCIGAFFTSANIEENIEANRLGSKLYDCSTPDIELEDAEFKLLFKAVKKTLNDQRYSVVIMSPILKLMKSVEDPD